MSAPPGAVLLDLDGTLMDSAPGILATHHATLIALGHVPDPAFDLNFAIGPALADVMHPILAHYGDDRVALGIETFRRIYAESGLLNASVFPGIPALLQALDDAGHPLYVATAKREDAAGRLLAHFGLAPRFRAIHGSIPGGALDHKPELIASILARYRLDPATTTMAGDRRYDVAGAHANRLRAVGVLWGYGNEAELTEAGADALAHTPADLLRLLS